MNSILKLIAGGYVRLFFIFQNYMLVVAAGSIEQQRLVVYRDFYLTTV